MPKIFHKGEWFHPLSPASLYETEFEDLLRSHSAAIRDNSWLVPFKKTVYSADSSARADLAIISKNYREWTVIEVEMVRHSLYGHVLPQVSTLKDGLYGPDHAEYLAKQEPAMSQQSLLDMLRGEDPEVLVLVDGFDAEWDREIKRVGARMMTFEIYRSASLTYAFHVDGEFRNVEDSVLTEIKLDSFLPNMAVVSSPALLGFRPGETIQIYMNGYVTDWERFDIKSTCYITTRGFMPLQRGVRYALIRNSDDETEIVEYKK